MSDTNIAVTIYHNIATDLKGRPVGMLDGYTTGQPLVPVSRYTSASFHPQVHHNVLETAFERFNIGGDGIADNYFTRGNRNLSVGDVVQLDDHFYACGRSGWEDIPAPAYFAATATTHGTVPLVTR